MPTYACRTSACVLALLRAQVVLVSASLRDNSLQQAKSWMDCDPIRICSEASTAVTGSTAAADADDDEQEDGEGAAVGAAGSQGRSQSQWSQMLPATITHQVRKPFLTSFSSAVCCHCFNPTHASVQMQTRPLQPVLHSGEVMGTEAGGVDLLTFQMHYSLSARLA